MEPNKNFRMNPHIQSSVPPNGLGQEWQKYILFSKQYWGSSHPKINSRRIKGLIVRPGTIITQNKSDKNLYDIRPGSFLDMIPKIQTTKDNINHLSPNQRKCLCRAKKTVNRTEKQPTRK